MQYEQRDPTRSEGDLQNGVKKASLNRLREQLDPLVPIFILVDPLVSDLMPGIDITRSVGALQTSRELAWQRMIVSVELSASIQLPHHMRPYMVQLHGVHDPLLELSFYAAVDELQQTLAGGLEGQGVAPHRVGGWLQTAMRGQALAKTIAEMCNVNTDAYTTDTYLRIADRRVLSLLNYVVNKQRVAEQMGQLRTWIFLDGIGELSRLDSSYGEIKRLRLNTVEWRRMEQGQYIHRTLAHWYGELTENATSRLFCLTDMYAAIENAHAQTALSARKWPHRFKTIDDHTAWTALLLVSPEIARRDSVQEKLASLGSAVEPAETVRYLIREISASDK